MSHEQSISLDARRHPGIVPVAVPKSTAEPQLAGTSNCPTTIEVGVAKHPLDHVLSQIVQPHSSLCNRYLFPHSHLPFITSAGKYSTPTSGTISLGRFSRQSCICKARNTIGTSLLLRLYRQVMN